MNVTGVMLTSNLIALAERVCDRLPVEADRYDGRFVLAAGGVLGFTLLAFWSLTVYGDVQWFAGEDGLSEWWSVAAYLASAVMAVVTARCLARLGYGRLGAANLLFAVAFVVGALEEISWGQRLFDWSTPEALTRINEQDETTIHNIARLKTSIYTGILWTCILGLAGSVLRAFLHHHRRVTTADFVMPSLLLSPALLTIAVWVGGGRTFRELMTHVDLRPVGTEVPEVLLGLCLIIFTYGNMTRALAVLNHEGQGRGGGAA